MGSTYVLQVHVRGGVRQSMVQCMVNGGEKGKVGEFRRNEEVSKMRGEARRGLECVKAS